MSKQLQIISIVSLIVAAAFITSISLRVPNFMQETGSPGLEATYHVLWTSKVLQETVAAHHFWLPSVTLSPEVGSPYAWGATVETKGGSFVYTSFPPLGFLVPAFLLSLASSDMAFVLLGLLNSLIGLLCAIVLGLLAKRVAYDCNLAGQEQNDQSLWAIFTATSVVYLLLNESLTSHGPVYWPHSLSQLFFILSCAISYRIYKDQCNFGMYLCLLLCSFVYCSLEWTGFVFCLGAAILCVVFRFGSSDIALRRRLLAKFLILAAASLLAAALLVIHFSIAIGIGDLIHVLSSRAVARSFNLRALLGIIPSYFESFGALFLLSLVFTFSLMTRRAQERPKLGSPLVFLLCLSTIPMIENLILLEHAYYFPFDRLKFALPMILVSVVFYKYYQYLHINLFAFIAVALVLHTNLTNFQFRNLQYQEWGATVRHNNQVVADFRSHALSDCVVLGNNGSARGHLNLLFASDIIERASLADLEQVIEAGDYCGMGLISTERVFTDQPRVTSITLYDLDGNRIASFGSSGVL
ncbi:MAG: hypothetical protein AAGM84_00625 [Pseudomonadota bacterium]